MNEHQRKQLRKYIVRILEDHQWNTSNTEIFDFVDGLLAEKDKEIKRLNNLIQQGEKTHDPK